jgi:hypothetical protein
MEQATQTQPDNAAQTAAAAATTTQQTTQQTDGATNGANGNTNGTTNGAATTVAGGAQQTTQQDPPSYWPKDWREHIAKYVSAGDEARFKKEMERLENTADPTAAWARFRDMETTWGRRNFVKLPPKEGATEADIQEYHKALGVPEKPEDYFKDLKLDNGAVLGDADKPVVDAFAAAVHKAGATPAVVSAAMNWYFASQEKAAADLDQADENFRIESERSLKEELGPAFARKRNAVAALFASAPGGTDVKNEKSLISRLLGGRTADGKIIGNDPDAVRFLINLALDQNPSAAVVEDGDQSGKSVEKEIAEIEQVMRTDRPRYNREFAGRYAELLATRSKIQARAARG